MRLGGVLNEKRVLSHGENQRKGDSVPDAVKPDLRGKFLLSLGP